MRDWLSAGQATDDMAKFEAEILETNFSEELAERLTPRLDLIAAKFRGESDSLGDLFLESVNHPRPESCDHEKIADSFKVSDLLL